MYVPNEIAPEAYNVFSSNAGGIQYLFTLIVSVIIFSRLVAAVGAVE